MQLKRQIERNASEILRLHNRIHETFLERGKSSEHASVWKQACRDFHDNYQSLAFPGGPYDARHRMRAGDNEAIEYALAFLEVRPYFFRSGYMYQEFMRVLRNCPLSDSQGARYAIMRQKYIEYRKNKRRTS